jgi:hypothetical protein
MTLTAGRTRGSRRLVELRSAWVAIAQTAAAAGFAWWITTAVLHHTRPIFAPISATIALGLNAGGRTRRAVEMVLGVALGIAVGDVLVDAIGTGPVQIGFVVLLAMSVAVVLGGGALLVGAGGNLGRAGGNAPVVGRARPDPLAGHARRRRHRPGRADRRTR